MATKLKTFDFPTRGRRSSYPWDEWLNGDIWKLIPGEDFTVSPKSLRFSFYRNASQRGMTANTSLLGDGALVVRAIVAEPVESNVS